MEQPPKKRKTPPSDDRKRLGNSGEDEAAELLRVSGHRILERNFRTRRGELDIVSRAPDGTLVFTEVKTDRSGRAGLPEEWIGPRKRRQVARMAAVWMALRGVGEVPVRFDAICVRVRPGRTHVLHWPAAWI